MSGNGITGFPYSGLVSDLETSLNLTKKFVTVIPITSNRHAMDVVANGYYQVASSVAVEAGSDNQNINITGHAAKKGDMIRILTSANSVEEEELAVLKVIDANNFQLAGGLSDVLLAGDTVGIYRSVAQRFSADGSTLASVTSPPLQFTKDAATVTVTEDTGTPANNIPLPVKIIDLNGDINVTAGDIGVQLSHLGGTPDSTRIGDGTTELGITVSNEAKTSDATAQTSLSNMEAQLPATLGQKTKAASMAVTLASDEDAIAITAAALPLPAGAATQATLSSLESKDFALNATLLLQSAKLPASIGQKTKAASMAVTLASDEDTINVAAASLPLPAGAATQATLALLEGKDFATQTTLATRASEATLAAQSAKLPASLGSKTSATSLSVTMSSDEAMPQRAGRVLRSKAVLDYSGTNVTSAAFVELLAATVGDVSMVEIFDSSGEVLIFSLGGAGSEVEHFYISPGGNGQIEFAITSATRISLKAQSTTASSGIIVANFYS